MWTRSDQLIILTLVGLALALLWIIAFNIPRFQRFSGFPITDPIRRTQPLAKVGLIGLASVLTLLYAIVALAFAIS